MGLEGSVKQRSDLRGNGSSDGEIKRKPGDERLNRLRTRGSRGSKPP